MKIRIYLEAKKEGKIKILKKINDKIDKGEVIAIINNNCDMDNSGNNDKPNNNLFDNSINNYTWKDSKDTNYSKLLLYGIYFPEYYWYIPTNIEEIIDIINIYSINNKGKEYFTKVISEAINLFENTITNNSKNNNSNYNNNSDQNNLINDNHDNSNNIMNIKLSRLNLLLLSIDKIITKYIDDNIIKLRDLLIDIIFKRLVYKYKNNNNKKNSFCYIPDIYLYSNKIDNIDNLTYSDNYPYILYNNKIINKEEEEIIIRNLKEYYNTSNIKDGNTNIKNSDSRATDNTKDDNNKTIDNITDDNNRNRNINNVNNGNTDNILRINNRKYNIEYKSPFRSLIILKEQYSFNRFIFLNINEYSNNKIVDMKNLSYAVNDVIATTKIYMYKDKSVNTFILNICNIINKNNDIHINNIESIIEDSIFYFKKIFIECKYKEAIINYKCYTEYKDKDRGIINYKYIIRYNNILEERLYKDGILIKRKIEGRVIDNIMDIEYKNIFVYLIKVLKNIDPIELYLYKNINDINDKYNLYDKDNVSYTYKDYIYNISNKIHNKNYIKNNISAYKYNYKNNIIIFIIMSKIYANGSFSSDELIFYYLLCRECREKGYLRIFINDNSGVRVGFSEDMLDRIEIRDNGIFIEDGNNKIEESALYIQDNNANVINTEKITLTDEYLSYNFKLISIFSNKNSGSENLSLSSLCAIETINAYNSIFTLSYVSGMSVGIGAYLCRLGNRIIMKKDSYMLLTGYQALNKLLGDNYYKSNLSLGGYEVLGKNGIVQCEVVNDMDGIEEIFRWIEYYIDGQSPHTKEIYDNTNKYSNMDDNTNECVNSNIGFNKVINKSIENYNEIEIIENIIDKNTYKEYMPNYAPNIITARAKIQNTTIAIISSKHHTHNSHTTNEENNKSTTNTQDINNKNDIESKLMPHVLHASSSQKFSEFISQINTENLNLLIIANYKGFSGGDKDMLDGVLKYGSNIINELKIFKNKIYIYIPPNGQLRGGTYVIFDKNINKNIRLTVHNTAEVGVLEPSALCEIKVKNKIKSKLEKIVNKYKNLNNNNNDNNNNEVNTYNNNLSTTNNHNNHNDSYNINTTIKTIAEDICKLQDNTFRLYKDNIIDEYVEVKELRNKIIEYFNLPDK